MRYQPLTFVRALLTRFRPSAQAKAVIAAVILGITLQIGSFGMAHAATSQNSPSPLGTNLAAVNYWSSEMPLLNIFSTAAQWITHGSSTWDTQEEQYLNLDANGWPISLTSVNEPSTQQFTSVGVLLLTVTGTANGYYPAGQYVVLYDGQGTLQYGFDASLVSHAAGRDVINVATPSATGIDLRITATDPNHTGNYIRNIRLVQATNEAALDAGQVFNPAFLSLIGNFHVLRFMDWLQTNGSSLSSWSSRPVPSNAFWGTSNGVPLEVAVELANATSADAWLNVPHQADNNYITQMATLVHAQLGAAQKAYVEFSNEVWNSSFAQYQYAATQGQATWPNQAGGNPNDWNRNWYGMRTAQMCDIWKSVWGSDSGRVVCVLAAQADSTYSATEALTCPYWSSAPCSGHNVNAVAIAPYFGNTGVPSSWTSQSDGGLSMLFQSLTSQNDPSIPVGGFLGHSAADEASYILMLVPYKLPLIAYESGQSFANGSTSALNSLYIAANRDPRMGTAYTSYLQQWKASGGQLLMLYNDIGAYASYGSWGALESVMQTTSPLTSAPPKWQAIQNFISGNACWWSACTGTTAATAPLAPAAFTIQ